MSYRSPRHSAEQWTKLVSEFDQSNETVQAFCTRHNLGFSTFNKWRRRLSVAPGVQIPASEGKGFVEAVRATQDVAAVTLYVGQSIRLVLPDTLGVNMIADLTHAVAARVGD